MLLGPPVLLDASSGFRYRTCVNVHSLQLDPQPAVAIMPLGTGNDLALNFGWGNAFLERWVAAPQVRAEGLTCLFRHCRLHAGREVVHGNQHGGLNLLAVTFPQPSALPYVPVHCSCTPR